MNSKITQYLLILLVLFPIISYSSVLDSLKIELRKARKAEDSMEILSSILKIENDKNNFKVFLIQLKKLNKRMKNTEKTAIYYRFLSDYYRLETRFKESENAAIVSIKLNLENNNYEELMKSYNQLGRIYIHFEKYDNALEELKKAETLVFKIKN